MWRITLVFFYSKELHCDSIPTENYIVIPCTDNYIVIPLYREWPYDSILKIITMGRWRSGSVSQWPSGSVGSVGQWGHWSTGPLAHRLFCFAIVILVYMDGITLSFPRIKTSIEIHYCRALHCDSPPTENCIVILSTENSLSERHGMAAHTRHTLLPLWYGTIHRWIVP